MVRSAADPIYEEPKMARTHEAQTLAEVFASEAETFVKPVAGFNIPVKRRYTEGHVCTAVEAQALSAYALDRKASVANSNIDRGTWKDKSDVEKTTLARDYLNGGEAFTDNIGGVFDHSLLVKAAVNVLAKANEAALTAAGITEPSAIRDMMAEPYKDKAGNMQPARVSVLLNDPSKTEAYHDRLASEMERILAERTAKRTRVAKDDAVEITF
jgi:hypothetical protein